MGVVTAFLIFFALAMLLGSAICSDASRREHDEARRRHPANWVEPGVYEVVCADCQHVIWHIPTDGADLLIVARESAGEWEPLLLAHVEVCEGRAVA